MRVLHSLGQFLFLLLVPQVNWGLSVSCKGSPEVPRHDGCGQQVRGAKGMRCSVPLFVRGLSIQGGCCLLVSWSLRCPGMPGVLTELEATGDPGCVRRRDPDPSCSGVSCV